jgi:hypothetical protein
LGIVGLGVLGSSELAAVSARTTAGRDDPVQRRRDAPSDEIGRLETPATGEDPGNLAR